jgi:hypothetical protein
MGEIPEPTVKPPKRLNLQPAIDGLEDLLRALAEFFRSFMGRAVILLFLLWPVFGAERLAVWITAAGADGVLAFLRGFAIGFSNIGGAAP